MAVIYGKLSGVGKLTGVITLTGSQRLKGFLTVPEGSGGPVIPDYEGTYEVTPNTSTQTLRTNGYKMTNNVTVRPIPSNYGLITWNGTTLFVS